MVINVNKNLNAVKSPERSQGLGGNIGCEDKNWFPNVITKGQQHNCGKKPTVILYTDINHYVRTPKQKQKTK